MNRRLFIHRSAILFTLASAGQGASCFGNTDKQELGYTIKQFEDEGLVQFSYAILADRKIVLVDPARDPAPYYAYAKEQGAKIIAVVETHSHADFVSSHLEIHQDQNVPVYVSKLLQATYPHQTFDDGDTLKISDHIILHAINTPGHSADSISVLLKDRGSDVAIFSGDAVLIGGVGRPDLREYSGQQASQREKLARQLFHTVNNSYLKLADHVLLYPAHGGGSFCGNAIKDLKQSTIGAERKQNFAFQKRSEEEFVQLILSDRSPIPVYFPYNVALNRKGAAALHTSLSGIPIIAASVAKVLESKVVDTRKAAQFRQSHFPEAINIPERSKSESWIGTFIAPQESFYLVADTKQEVQLQLEKLAKIGYEQFVKAAVIYGDYKGQKSATFDQAAFDRNQTDYFIVDVRTVAEAKAEPVFKEAHNIPLAELTQHIAELPLDKIIVVHCASGYRSAIASSLINELAPGTRVWDVGEHIKEYKQSKN
ncbi:MULTISPECIES: MBL fold metallo-hydrolase [Sphingobacterium]|uniref:MBL fold metallo-hydrolase n=1 Tax=Sphingobacterium TaxID=28453 RepID=UPI0025808045|nr:MULTISPECIES: MBL fold metallo-hydrolase [Sphingobacterium]